MIDKGVFTDEWKALLVRFGRKVDDANKEQGRRFYAFLSPQMDTEAFVRAARSVWATSRFFPRPADFLLVESGPVWAQIMDLLRAYSPPAWGNGITAHQWWERWQALPQAARDAADAIGDVEQLQKLAQTQSIRFREQWERTFEQQRTSEAVAALPPPRRTLSLPSGQP